MKGAGSSMYADVEGAAARSRLAERIRRLGAYLTEAGYAIERGRIAELAHDVLDGGPVATEHAYAVVARVWLAEMAAIAVSCGELDGMAQGRAALAREQDLTERRARASVREMPPLAERLELVPPGGAR